MVLKAIRRSRPYLQVASYASAIGWGLFNNFPTIMIALATVGAGIWAIWTWAGEYNYLPVFLVGLFTLAACLNIRASLLSGQRYGHVTMPSSEEAAIAQRPLADAGTRYTQADKDKISDALVEVSEMLRTEVEPLCGQVQKTILAWENGKANPTSDEIAKALITVDSAAFDVNKVCESVNRIRKKYSVEKYRLVVDEALSLPHNKVVIPLFEMQAALCDFKACLNEAELLHQAAPMHKGPLYRLMHEMTRRLDAKRMDVHIWISACDYQIKKIEERLLH